MNYPDNDIRFDRAMYIRELQQMLRTLAFDNLQIPLISVDGIFGQETANAVTAAQTQLQLPSDGRVNFPTWVALVKAVDDIRRKNQPPMAIPAFQAGDPAAQAQAGEPCDAALGAQMMCRSLSRNFANITCPELTGVWDAKTVSGLKEIQQICGLPVTGQIDTPTWNGLTQAYSLFCRNTRSPH